MQGKISEWYDDKGYGFIVTPERKRKIFVHVSELRKKGLRPKVNAKVCFELGRDSQGRINAVNVNMQGAASLPLAVVFGCAFVVFVSGTTLLMGGAVVFIPLYLLLSLVTYLVYARDKNAALQGTWRIPEKTLHLLALAGGWPGALWAQNQLRHKSQKQPFKAILWLTIVLNIAAFSWTLSQPGHALIQHWLP
ncbi:MULTISPECIES: DUF1294 domain-containing protein [Vibrio]|uniref:Cold shock and DUF1294 domain-containing protein n=1 Tax=Vibrio ostreae TaxID=2841925 RepID=A0A975U577_9VIBR|nr:MULTISPECIES: cold shock and DUF1294 domain-containing protein [Vibrio]QXO15429.1 cold shock and DUF1294 domain-containing protein [Vibrio ostreae]WGY45370.1 cold shock and DUF1294 domain-containing protein [Vibrio sp. ABG19]